MRCDMRIKRSYLHHLIFGMLFLLLYGIHRFRIAGILSSVLMLLYIYCSVSIWKETIFLKYMTVTFVIAFSTFGLLICEYGNLWLGEIGRVTSYNGSLPTLLFYFWLLINVIILTDKHWERVTRKGEIRLRITDRLTSSSMIKKAPIFVFIFNTALFLAVIRTPFFLVGAENRFVYRRLYLSRAVSLLQLLPCLFNAILIMPIVHESRNGRIGFMNMFIRLLLPNIPYFLFMIWTGNKFGSFWETLYLVLIPVFSILDLKKINAGKIIRMAILILIVFIGILYLFYYLLGMNMSESSMSLFLRSACQGELWWSAYDQVNKNGIQLQEFGKELSYIANSVVTEGGSETYGVYHLMNLLGVKTVVERYLQMGIRFSACGIELPYLFFGFLSLPIVALIYGNVYALFTNIYINSVKEERIIGCVAAGRLYSVALAAIAQGDWYVFTSLISIFCLCVIIVTYLVPSHGLRSRKNHRSVGGVEI